MDLQKRHQQEIKKYFRKKQTHTDIRFTEEAYEKLLKLQELVNNNTRYRTKPTYSQLLTSINHTITRIKQDYLYGDLVPRKQLPKSLITKYGTNKILRVELTGYWRLLYTLVGNEIEIIALVLDFMNHKEYDKLFEYRKK